MTRPVLALVYEPEAACLDRLRAAGYAEPRAREISSYLAQATDIEPELETVGAACDARGLAFLPIELDESPQALSRLDPEKTLVWTLTDGIAYFRGGAAPAVARLNGLSTFGSDDTLFALCQDKFRSGAVLAAFGLPVPAAGLARNGEWLIFPPQSLTYFVKPNRLGAKIGIWPDSHCATADAALELSRRVFAAYGDDVVVQPYVPGRNVRASFLSAETGAGAEALGVFLVESGGDFQTMEDSLALYGGTGAQAIADGRYREPELIALANSQPEADAEIRRIAARLMDTLGLRDVFSLDFRVEDNGRVHLIEFEVCPGLPCFDFRAYCRSQWGKTLADAMAAAAVSRLGRPPSKSPVWSDAEMGAQS